MKSKSMVLSGVVAVALAALGAGAYAQGQFDKYTLKSPGGIAFSDFRGYESWEMVSSARTDTELKVMLANPVMINAYKAGIPGNGQAFPEGSKIVKLQWKHEKSKEAPFVVEIHKKYAIPTACLVFVLLGAPLAVRSGRSGMTMAIAFSISCFLVYYLFLTGGEKLADRELLSPFWAMWAANAFFGSIGVVLTWRCVVDASVFNYRRLDPRTWWPFRRLAA